MVCDGSVVLVARSSGVGGGSFVRFRGRCRVGMGWCWYGLGGLSELCWTELGPRDDISQPLDLTDLGRAGLGWAWDGLSHLRDYSEDSLNSEKSKYAESSKNLYIIHKLPK